MLGLQLVWKKRANGEMELTAKLSMDCVLVLMGTNAGIGDSLLLVPFDSSSGIALAFKGGNALGAIFYIVVWNLVPTLV